MVRDSGVLRIERSPKSRGRAKGQAMVEFALVAPLFLLMLFGVIEFSFISASITAFNAAAKDAARLGSLLGRTATDADSQMLALIRSRVSGVVMAKTTKIEIYKADVTGTMVMSSGAPVEDVYTLDGTAIGTPNWPPSSRNDTLSNADYLGVRITYVYTYLTSFIAGAGTTLTLTANSVQRIEPTDYQSRHAVPGRLASLPAAALSGSIAWVSGANSPGESLWLVNRTPLLGQREREDKEAA